MRVILGALTAVTLLAGVAAAQPAQARCWWNGVETVCTHFHHHWWWRHHPDWYR